MMALLGWLVRDFILTVVGEDESCPSFSLHMAGQQALLLVEVIHTIRRCCLHTLCVSSQVHGCVFPLTSLEFSAGRTLQLLLQSWHGCQDLLQSRHGCLGLDGLLGYRA